MEASTWTTMVDIFRLIFVAIFVFFFRHWGKHARTVSGYQVLDCIQKYLVDFGAHNSVSVVSNLLPQHVNILFEQMFVERKYS